MGKEISHMNMKQNNDRELLLVFLQHMQVQEMEKFVMDQGAYFVKQKH